MTSRRRFLGTSAALVGLTCKAGRSLAGGFVDGSYVLGHRLRDRGAFPAPARTVRLPLVIVGGGVAGLSAAWRLDKRGFHDFVVTEMEPRAGGNARWGENEVSAYPWGAHYVPVPGRRATLVRELFEELGVLRSGQWEERYLCFDPQERLFLHGAWQDGLEPATGLGATGNMIWQAEHRHLVCGAGGPTARKSDRQDARWPHSPDGCAPF